MTRIWKIVAMVCSAGYLTQAFNCASSGNGWSWIPNIPSAANVGQTIQNLLGT